jgi:hypothetical protein
LFASASGALLGSPAANHTVWKALQLEVPDLLAVGVLLVLVMEQHQVDQLLPDLVFNIREVVAVEVQKITLQEIVRVVVGVKDLLLSLTVALKIK